MMKRLLAIVLALLIPPLSVLLWRGPGLGVAANLILAVAGITIFFGFYAGPGLAIYGLAILHALLLSLLAGRSSPALAR